MDRITMSAFNVQTGPEGEHARKEEPRILPDRVEFSDAPAAKNQPLISADSLPSAISAVKQEQPPPEFPRPMSDEEKQLFHEIFPVLDVDKAVVTGEATQAYNCISWTVGETNQWFWPPYMYPELSELEAFDTFYGSYGLKPAQSGEVARWKNAEGLTHGCISGPDHGPRWESKCGGLIRIQHDLNELNSEVYGWVDGYYTKEEEGSEPMKQSKPLEIPQEVLEGVKEIAAKVSPDVKDKFEGAYARWQNFRKEPRVRLSANPADYCKTDAFKEITGMGAQALPLLMEKIAQGDFFCLQAVEKISEGSAPHEAHHVPQLAGDEHNNSEQTRAALRLMKWYARV